MPHPFLSAVQKSRTDFQKVNYTLGGVKLLPSVFKQCSLEMIFCRKPLSFELPLRSVQVHATCSTHTPGTKTAEKLCVRTPTQRVCWRCREGKEQYGRRAQSGASSFPSGSQKVRLGAYRCSDVLTADACCSCAIRLMHQNLHSGILTRPSDCIKNIKRSQTCSECAQLKKRSARTFTRACVPVFTHKCDVRYACLLIPHTV